MKLTRRETVLICVLAALVLLAGSYMLLFAPLREQVAQRQAQLENLEQTRQQMAAVLDNPSLQSAYDSQLAQAQQQYDAFYATLNTYTIDDIFRALLDEHGIAVAGIQISAYQPVTAKMADEAGLTLVADDETLLRLTCEVDGEGDLEDTLDFLRAMNQKSFSLVVRESQITLRSEENLLEHEARFHFVVDVYGVAAPEGVSLSGGGA